MTAHPRSVHVTVAALSMDAFATTPLSLMKMADTLGFLYELHNGHIMVLLLYGGVLGCEYTIRLKVHLNQCFL